jgi:hypothetical protein
MKFVIALALVLSAPAFAAPTVTTCQLPELSGSVEVSFTAPDEANKFGVTTTKLVLSDAEIPMVRTSCFYKNIPGERGFLCAHEDSTTRYDIYPRFAKDEAGMNTGVVAKVIAVKWSAEGKPTSFTSEDCR